LLLLDPLVASGADFLIQAISPQTVRLFQAGVHHNRAAPRSLLEQVNARFGPYPGGADAYALEHGWITEADYLYLIEHSTGWIAGVTSWLFEMARPDLLLAWQETFDAAGHAFLLADPRQASYSDERARQYEGYFLRAAQAADQALEMMLAQVDLRRTAVLLVSDHGMAPAHTQVYVNTILERAGLLVLDSRDYVVVERSRAMAVASGGAANIYLNLQGREEGGIVNPEEYQAVQQAVIEALASLADPATGQLVFARVLPRQALDRLGLGHPHSGDVFVQANPGYTLDGWRGEADLFEPFTACGQHGYESRLPEMRALFMAAGAGLRESGGEIPPVRLVDLAPTIAVLLDFPFVSGLDGQVIPNLLIP
jgi:predicted AlkP superfamily phosphohydrolase/phosphomutase